MKTVHAIEQWPVERLVPYDRNARTHSEAQVAQIAASITQFGFNNPILVDSANGIIAGHGRLQAARKMGLATVPVIVLAHLSEAQRRAYILADNKLAMNAGWDEELLLAELRDLDEMIDLSLTGFDANELERMFADGDDDGRADECPDAPETPVTRRGDLWVLGRHRVLCGDATSAEDVARLMNGKRADVTLTDPPYGLGNSATEKNKYDSYDDSRENLISLVAQFLPVARRLTNRVVLTPGNRNQWLYPEPSWTMAWFTPAGVGRGPWGFCCWQPILCYGKDPLLSSGQGSYPDAIVHTEASEQFGHPCTKPIRFWQWLMERTCEANATVFEPFAGSGTTFIAAEKTKRACYGTELSEAYVDVIVNRWQEFTGQTAALDGDGRTFGAVAHERRETA